MKFLANWWKCKVMQRDVHSLGALFVREMFQCREKKAKGVLRVFLSVSVTYTKTDSEPVASTYMNLA